MKCEFMPLASLGWVLATTLLFLTASPTLVRADALFSAPFRSFRTESFSQGVAVGDLNHDGHPDVVTANRDIGGDPCASSVSVLLGNGDGTFLVRNDYVTGVRSDAVAIGDLDADGHPDLVVADRGPQEDEYCDISLVPTVSVLLGNGDGVFRYYLSFPVSVVGSIELADLNADGRLDLAMAGLSGCAIWFGSGDGTFGVETIISNTNTGRLATADLDADGRLDLVVTNQWAHSISVRRGNGDGTFQPKIDYSVAIFPLGVAIGDLNGDGWPDLMVGSAGNDTLTVLLGIGDGTFHFKSGLGTPAPAIIETADFDRDGYLDLVGMGGIVSENASVMRFMPGRGDGTFGAETSFFTGGQSPRCIAVADFNGDWKPDLAVVTGRSLVSIHLGNGDGTFGAATDTVGVGSRPAALTTADFNRDGHLDLAVANSTSNSVSVLMGSGNGTFHAKTDYGVGVRPVSVAAGDIDGDGSLDLVVANWLNQGLSVLLGNGDGTFRSGQYVGPVYSPNCVAMADLNGDGRLDLAVAAEHLRAGVSILLGNGDGTFGAKTDFYIADDDALATAIGDLNGDGRLDLVVVAGFPTRVSVLFGNGDGTFTIMGDLDAGPHARSAAIGDLNADGRLDIVVGGDIVAVWLGSNDGWFGTRSDYSGGSAVMIADLDADGRLDLATAGGGVWVLLGKGDGSFEPGVGFGSGPFHNFVLAGDFNEDERPDLAVTNFFGSTISIFPSGGMGPPTTTLLSMFEATWVESRVEVRWQFGSGSQVTSANVERSEATTGPWLAVDGEARHEGDVTLLLDGGVEPGREYFYRLHATLQGGETVTFGPISILGAGSVQAFEMTALAPNPTEGAARITFTVPRAARIRIAVLDLQGRRVALLTDGTIPPGRHQVVWDGTRGRTVAAAGLYFVRCEWPGGSATRRLVLAR